MIIKPGCLLKAALSIGHGICERQEVWSTLIGRVSNSEWLVSNTFRKCNSDWKGIRTRGSQCWALVPFPHLSHASSRSSQSQQHAATWLRPPFLSTYSQQHKGSSGSGGLWTPLFMMITVLANQYLSSGRGHTMHLWVGRGWWKLVLVQGRDRTAKSCGELDATRAILNVMDKLSHASLTTTTLALG